MTCSVSVTLMTGEIPTVIMTKMWVWFAGQVSDITQQSCDLFHLLSLDEYRLPVSNVRVVAISGAAITVAWEVNVINTVQSLYLAH